MAFERFHKGSAPLTTVPSVTIQRRGLFSLNEAAYGLLGRPEGIQFHWDPDERLIGLRGARLDEPDAYPARAQASTRKRKGEGQGPVLVAGTMFTKFVGIDTTQAKRWVPTLDGDLLIIDLKQEGSVVVANRHRSREVSQPSESTDE